MATVSLYDLEQREHDDPLYALENLSKSYVSGGIRTMSYADDPHDFIDLIILSSRVLHYKHIKKCSMVSKLYAMIYYDLCDETNSLHNDFKSHVGYAYVIKNLNVMCEKKSQHVEITSEEHEELLKNIRYYIRAYNRNYFFHGPPEY